MYTITVAAINGAGEGDRSTAITQRTDMARECANCLKSVRAAAAQLNHKPSLVPRPHFFIPCKKKGGERSLRIRLLKSAMRVCLDWDDVAERGLTDWLNVV